MACRAKLSGDADLSVVLGAAKAAFTMKPRCETPDAQKSKKGAGGLGGEFSRPPFQHPAFESLPPQRHPALCIIRSASGASAP